MNDHDRLGEWSAAFVLGSLDTADRAEFERHLESCAQCKADVTSFAPIPGLLAKADLGPRGSVPTQVLAEATGRVASERRSLIASRRRWRIAAVAAVLATIVISSSGLGGPAVNAVALEPAWGVTGEVTVSARTWGTEVGFDLQQLPPEVTCIAWAVDTAGEWQPVAWWGPTPTHRARVTGSSSLQLEDVTEIVVTTTDREQIVTRAPLSDS